METEDRLDLVWGVGDIGILIGRNYRQTYHMIQKGHLPMVKQVGERWVADRKKLEEFFSEVTA